MGALLPIISSHIVLITYIDMHIVHTLTCIEPFRFIRRGRAATPCSDEYELESDVSDSELASWVQKPGRSIALQFLSKGEDKMAKFLPPGNIMELYQHYASTRQLLGVDQVSSVPELFSRFIVGTHKCQKHPFH